MIQTTRSFEQPSAFYKKWSEYDAPPRMTRRCRVADGTTEFDAVSTGHKLSQRVLYPIRNDLDKIRERMGFDE